MADTIRRHFRQGFLANSLGTLSSRILGLLRDMTTAALLGLDTGGVMDAFVVAFRIPNLFRRLFGEGALAASYLPVLSQQLERDREAAWQLASALLGSLAVGLTVLVLIGEAICGLLWATAGANAGMSLLAGLTAAMLPYLVLICLAAQVSATLQALYRFSIPALAPTLLNLCWLLAAWLVAPRFASDPAAQAYVLAAAVVVSGVLQVAVQLPTLWRLGFRFQFDWRAVREPLGRVARSMIPIGVGLAATQINTFIDSLLAWGLAARAGSETIAWLGGIAYPMRAGAAAAIYYAERLYQFPIGLLGISVATVIYPLLSRHAARGQRHLLAADLTFGLRFVWFIAFPAGVGLMLLAEPLARLLFERGQFTPQDAHRAARLIACYAIGVWAYCALPVLVRGYYALGDRRTPVRVSLIAVVLNLTANLVLIWPLAETGLALSTAMSATVQVALLSAALATHRCGLAWSELLVTAAKTTAATLVMAVVAGGMLWLIDPGVSKVDQLARVSAVVVSGGASFLLAALLLRCEELYVLAGSRRTLGE